MDNKKLVEAALQARESAYAPYSDFLVGAALLTKDNMVYTGCNIENAAFTPTNCAERTAFFQAVKEGKRDFEAIAIVGAARDAAFPFSACPPCGVCLQVMLEFCDPQSFRVILGTDQEHYQEYRLAQMIPYGFSMHNE